MERENEDDSRPIKPGRVMVSLIFWSGKKSKFRRG
jgi:hypothetical protein